mmetsp:Transcript_12203/g.24112  ORF Transcript_12203/g.24112 Transcript_12203/m.24112 type:complete len:209 (+) Transcript_12203:92-718(+)
MTDKLSEKGGGHVDITKAAALYSQVQRAVAASKDIDTAFRAKKFTDEEMWFYFKPPIFAALLTRKNLKKLTADAIAQAAAPPIALQRSDFIVDDDGLDSRSNDDLVIAAVCAASCPPREHADGGEIVRTGGIGVRVKGGSPFGAAADGRDEESSSTDSASSSSSPPPPFLLLRAGGGTFPCVGARRFYCGRRAGSCCGVRSFPPAESR